MNENQRYLSKELPSLKGEPLYIPFVGAIIERIEKGKRLILIQIRDKPSDTKYHGCYEIPGGKCRAFEDIYATLRREVKEECGLELSSITGESNRLDYVNQEDTSTLFEPFCVTQMSNGPSIGMIFLCEAQDGVPLLQTSETKEAKFIPIEELNKIINETPEKVYTDMLAPLKKYLSFRMKN